MINRLMVLLVIALTVLTGCGGIEDSIKNPHKFYSVTDLTIDSIINDYGATKVTLKKDGFDESYKVLYDRDKDFLDSVYKLKEVDFHEKVDVVIDGDWIIASTLSKYRK